MDHHSAVLRSAATFTILLWVFLEIHGGNKSADCMLYIELYSLASGVTHAWKKSYPAYTYWGGLWQIICYI